MDNRYQNQSILIKIYRWLKWKPLYFAKALLFTFKTIFNKNLLWDSYEKAYFRRNVLFSLILSKSDSKMNHYYTMDEVKQTIYKK